MKRNIVIKGVVVTPFETIHGGMVIVDGSKVAYVGVADEVEAKGQVYDFGDSFVTSGFVDLHVHGGAGFDVMDTSPEALAGLAGFLAEGGVTSFLPTTSSMSFEDMMEAALAVRTSMRRGTTGAEVLGLHLEGPYLNPVRRGAQSAVHIRPPSVDELLQIQRESGKNVKMITLAPEIDGALEAVARLGYGGVVLSAGHTDATFDEMEAAIDAGFRHVTHLFNGMRPFHHREPGVAGAAFMDRRVTVDVIADGVHLHPATLGLTVTAKGAGKTVLVSDSIMPAGLPDGEYRLGDQRVHLRDGKCLMDSGVLAGSTIRLNDAVRNLVELVGVPLPEAVEMASSTPSRIIGVDDRKGCLKPGMDADLTVFNRDFSILLTMVDGKVVYLKS